MRKISNNLCRAERVFLVRAHVQPRRAKCITKCHEALLIDGEVRLHSAANYDNLSFEDAKLARQ